MVFLLWLALIQFVWAQDDNETDVSMPQIGRFGHSTVLLPNGTMYVYGGYDYKSTDFTGTEYIGLKNDMWGFNLATQVWTPVNYSSLSLIPIPTAFHSTELYFEDGGYRMRIFGGTPFFTSAGPSTTSFSQCGADYTWVFDFDTAIWDTPSNFDFQKCRVTNNAYSLSASLLLVGLSFLMLAGL